MNGYESHLCTRLVEVLGMNLIFFGTADLKFSHEDGNAFEDNLLELNASLVCSPRSLKELNENDESEEE